MKVSSINEFINGWFIGNFEPSVLKSEEFEVAHHKYAKGFRGTPHTHKIATEYNYIVKGKLIASGVELSDGEMFVYSPDEISEVTFLEDTDLIIIKTPSVPGDKYE